MSLHFGPTNRLIGKMVEEFLPTEEPPPGKAPGRRDSVMLLNHRLHGSWDANSSSHCKPQYPLRVALMSLQQGGHNWQMNSKHLSSRQHRLHTLWGGGVNKERSADL